jgi:adhesin transport system outer membrane protein
MTMNPKSLRRTPLILGILLVLCAEFAVAQEVAKAPAQLTFRYAVSEAVLRHPTRVRAAHEVATAGFQREGAEWGRFPKFTADVSPRISGDQAAGTANVVMRVEQPLWAGGRIDGAIDAARARVSAAESAEAEARQRIVERAALAYVAWIYATERVETARSGAEVLSGLLNYVRSREKEGAASAADVAIATARYVGILAIRNGLQGARDQARAELESATMLSGFSRGVAVNVPAYAALAADKIEAAYLGQSPLITQRRAEVESTRAQAAVKRGEMFPQLSLRVERYGSVSGGAALAGDPTRTSLVLQYVPGAGLSSSSNYQAAASQVNTALAQVSSDENEVRLRARTHLAEYLAARAQVADFEPLVAALELASSSFMRQFEAGRKTWLEVLNTHRETIDAKISLSSAQTSRDQSALRLMINEGSFWSWMEKLPR